MKKICFITTISITLKGFLIETAKYLHDNGDYDITFICNNDGTLREYIPNYVHYIPIAMKRGISLSGINSICELYGIFKREKFDIVQYSTPNAAFYASISAKMANIPVRLYCQWGIRYVGFEGIYRKIFKMIEKKICSLSTHIEAESFNIYNFSIDEGLYSREKGKVIWNGSACGVNLEKYDYSHRNAWRKEIRNKYGIKDSTILLGYTGRITKDKGINELLAACKEIFYQNDCKLMLVGSIDNENSINKELYHWSLEEPKVIYCGWTNETEKYLSSLDIFVSPSYREGFGLVVIEAESMGIPAIVSNVPGQVDAIIEGKTGISVQVKNWKALENGIQKLIEDKELRAQMGGNACEFVKDNYEQKMLFEHILKEREMLYKLKSS
ncbi:MAG: glycosyltransferase [Clostridiaceae bacterium]